VGVSSSTAFADNDEENDRPLHPGRSRVAYPSQLGEHPIVPATFLTGTLCFYYQRDRQIDPSSSSKYSHFRSLHQPALLHQRIGLGFLDGRASTRPMSGSSVLIIEEYVEFGHHRPRLPRTLRLSRYPSHSFAMDQSNHQEPQRTPTAPTGNIVRFPTNPWTPPSSGLQHQNPRQHAMPSLVHSLIPGSGAPYRQNRGPVFLGQHGSLPPLEFRMSPLYPEHEPSAGLAHGRSDSVSRIPDTPPVLPQLNFGPSILSPGEGPVSDGDSDGASGTGAVHRDGGGGGAGRGLSFPPPPVRVTALPGATLETHSPLAPALLSIDAQPSTSSDTQGSQPSAISQQPLGAGFTRTTNPRHSSSDTAQTRPSDFNAPHISPCKFSSPLLTFFHPPVTCARLRAQILEPRSLSLHPASRSTNSISAPI
jgi:hypothetical protein